MKTKLNQGFTLIELLVVITIIAILASLAVPTFGRIQERGNITKAISNCKQIITSLRLYSSDHNGLYPDQAQTDDGTGQPATVSDSNAAFRELFKEAILDSETIFGCPVSRIGNPDGKVGTAADEFDEALKGVNENHWSMTKNASDAGSGSLPLVYEVGKTNTWDPTWDPTLAGQITPGRSWSGGKIVIGQNDASVALQDLADKQAESALKGGNENLFKRFTGDYDVLKPLGATGG